MGNQAGWRCRPLDSLHRAAKLDAAAFHSIALQLIAKVRGSIVGPASRPGGTLRPLGRGRSVSQRAIAIREKTRPQRLKDSPKASTLARVQMKQGRRVRLGNCPAMRQRNGRRPTLSPLPPRGKSTPQNVR
jgi:hypothetical protein